MAERKIELPDGRVMVIDAPEGATDADLIEFAQSQVEADQAVPASAPIPQGQVAAQAGGNDEFSIAEQEANDILGVDPNIETRGQILPFGRNRQGEMEFAVPEMALSIARSLLLPGQALRGTEVETGDIANLALNVGVPAKGVAAVKRPSRITAEQIANAPSALDLTKASGAKFKGSRQAGANLSADDYVGFLAGAERDIVEEGVDAALHPKLTAVFNKLTGRIGQEMDAKELHKIRRTIGIATNSLEPDEARIARVLRNNFDDFVETLPGTDQWKAARKQYIQARKLETVESAIEKAGRTASGLENGMRIELRKLLNNERKMRNFSKVEKDAMQAVVDGDFTTNSLKRLGKLGFGRGAQSNFLGGSIGIGAGGAVGGPVGAIAAPAVGAAAQRQAEKQTLRAADTLRALIGGARPEPRSAVVPSAAGAAIGPLITSSDALNTQVE